MAEYQIPRPSDFRARQNPKKVIAEAKNTLEGLAYISRISWKEVGCKLLSFGVLDVLLDILKSKTIDRDFESVNAERPPLDWIFGSIVCIGHVYQVYPSHSHTKMPKRWSTQILRDLPLVFTWTLYICSQRGCLTDLHKLDLVGSWYGLHNVIEGFSEVLDSTPGAPEFVAHMWVASLQNGWYIEGGVTNSSTILSSLAPLRPHISSIVVREAGGTHRLARLLRRSFPEMISCPLALGPALAAIRALRKVDPSLALSLASKRTITMFSNLIKVWGEQFPHIYNHTVETRCPVLADMFGNLFDILMLLSDNPPRLVRVLPRSLIRDITGSFPYMQTEKFKYTTGWWSLQLLASMLLQPLLAYPEGFRMISLAYHQDLKGPGFRLFQNSLSYPTAVIWSQLIQVIDWMQDVESKPVITAMHLGVSKSCFNSQCPQSLEVACRKVCGGCHGSIYCSRKCQKAHWLTHKHFCPGIPFHGTRYGMRLLASQREMHVRQVFTSLLTTNINEFLKKLPSEPRTAPLVVEASFQYSCLSFTIHDWSSSSMSRIFPSEGDARDDAEVIQCEGKVGTGPVLVHLDLRISTMEQWWRSHGMMYIALDEFSLARSD